MQHLRYIDRLIVFTLVQCTKHIQDISRDFAPNDEITRPNKLELKTRLVELSVKLTNENGNEYNVAPRHNLVSDIKGCLIAQHRNV